MHDDERAGGDAGKGALTRSATYTLFVLFAANLLNFYDRTVLGSLTEPIRQEFKLSDSTIGWLGTAFVLLYAAVGLPFGRWADRGSRPALLATGIALWSGFTALGGAAWNFATLAVARMGVGIGEAACAPAANSLIGDLFSPRQRARALSVFMLGLPMGVLLSSIVSGVVAKVYGWRMALFVAAIPGVIVALLAARLVDPPRQQQSLLLARRSFWSDVGVLLRIPTFRWIAITGALHNFNAYAINAFMPAYLGRYHGLDIQRANVITGFMLGGVGIVSLVLTGIAADRARQWRDNGRLLVATAAIFLAAPTAYLALTQTPGHVAPFAVWMGVSWALAYVYYATVYASIHDVVPSAMRGSAMSLYFFCMYVLGGAFGTALLGMLSDRMARRAMTSAGAMSMSEVFRATGLHDAFFIVPVLFAILAATLFAASRTVSRDMRSLTAPQQAFAATSDRAAPPATQTPRAPPN